MTKEELLKSYLADDLLMEKGYLKPGEAEAFKWTDRRPLKLVAVLKIAIEGELSDEGDRITERKVNQLFNTNP